MRLTTIKELGRKLPVGSVQDGKLVKEFSLRPHEARTDRLLNAWREANKGKHLAWEVCKYLSLSVASIGQEAFPLSSAGDSTPETEIRFLDMPFGDVMYLWMYCRILAVEEACEVPYACPRCGLKSKAVVDLWGTEVMVAESPAELLTWVELKQGIRLRDTKSKATAICLRPAPFRALLFQGASEEGTDSMGYSQLRECVVKMRGAPEDYLLRDEELDTLSRMDWLRLDRAGAKVTGGPRMRTPVTCEGSVVGKDGKPAPCGNVMEHALDWSYDSFFDSSVPLGRLTS